MKTDPTRITSDELAEAQFYLNFPEIIPVTTRNMLRRALANNNRMRLIDALRLARRYDVKIGEAIEDAVKTAEIEKLIADDEALQALKQAQAAEAERRRHECVDQFQRGMAVAHKLRSTLRELSDMVAIDKRRSFEEFICQIDDMKPGHNQQLTVWITQAKQRIAAYEGKKRQRGLAQNHKPGRGAISYA